MRLYIKNMVCDRCKMAVRKVLEDNGFHPLRVELGVADTEEDIDAALQEKLRNDLQAQGFELLDDRRWQTISQVKAAIVRLVHGDSTVAHGRSANVTAMKLSAYLQQELHQDYSALSKLFSEYTSMTIERYYMEQRIERAKELLTYGELTLSEIALRMNYSSTAYLSSQFKAVTGMTPTQFKHLEHQTRRELDKI